MTLNPASWCRIAPRSLGPQFGSAVRFRLGAADCGGAAAQPPHTPQAAHCAPGVRAVSVRSLGPFGPGPRGLRTRSCAPRCVRSPSQEGHHSRGPGASHGAGAHDAPAARLGRMPRSVLPRAPGASHGLFRGDLTSLPTATYPGGAR